MAKTRERKQEEVQKFVEGLGSAKSVIFAEIAGLPVNDANAFRRTADKEDVSVTTAKKTLLRIALKEAKYDMVDENALQGSVTLLLGMSDAVAPAKAVSELGKTSDKVKIFGGILENRWMSKEEVMALAKLPSREQLLAQVVGSISAPMSGFVNVCAGNLRSLVYVLNAIKDSKS